MVGGLVSTKNDEKALRGLCGSSGRGEGKEWTFERKQVIGALEDVLCSVGMQAGQSEGDHNGEDLQWHYVHGALWYHPSMADTAVASGRMGCRPTCNSRIVQHATTSLTIAHIRG